MWYQEPGWFALIISFGAAIVTFVVSLRTFKITHATHSTYQCDAQFLEIEKLFISEPSLYDFYRLGPEMTAFWDKLSENDKRLYILTEIHYFHLAFAYREYKAGRVTSDYWNIYKNWLNTLVQHCPMFLQVHEREAKNFEDDFAKLVVQMRSKRDAQAARACQT